MIFDTAVIGQWRLGMAVLGSDGQATLFEEMKKIISSGSLQPPPGDDHERAGEEHRCATRSFSKPMSERDETSS